MALLGWGQAKALTPPERDGAYTVVVKVAAVVRGGREGPRGVRVDRGWLFR